MDFRPLDDTERQTLYAALRQNRDEGAALLMSRDTSFSGTAQDVTDDEVISAIKSIPMHY